MQRVGLSGWRTAQPRGVSVVVIHSLSAGREITTAPEPSPVTFSSHQWRVAGRAGPGLLAGAILGCGLFQRAGSVAVRKACAGLELAILAFADAHGGTAFGAVDGLKGVGWYGPSGFS